MTFTMPVAVCPRCGKEHKAVVFKAFDVPMKNSNGTHWGQCENTKDPIVICIGWVN